ncbi:MAG: bifunctional DNA primase/polymerase, partial [Candidatus Limnocylindrus sp.]
MAQLKGLPNEWRYVLTGGNDDSKRAFEPNWNAPGHGRTLDDVIRLNVTPNAGERWINRKTIGLGVITGTESHGLLVLDFDGQGSQAVRAFIGHFHKRASTLPPTVANISGKQGRCKLYYRVPPEWWPQLEGKSATWKSELGDVVLEGIWQNSTGCGRHAVICGDHPESSHQNPLYYRWVEGCAPDEMEVADAPEWLLLGIKAQMEGTGEKTFQEQKRSGEDDPTPWERLTVGERCELIESALEKCPNREGKGSGTYDKVRRVLCALLNELGLPLAQQLVEYSDWDKRNDWGPNMSAAATMQSLAKSRSADDKKATIASVFFFARNAGWMPPSWAIPAVETKAQVDGYRKLINEMIQHHDDSLATSFLLGRARREYSVDSDTVRTETLVHFIGIQRQLAARGLIDIKTNMRKDNVDSDVIDGFLGRRVHLMAGASHSGKTTFACFLANRVALGLPVDIDSVRHPTERPGKVMIFTSDCSDGDMVRELAMEGVTGDNDGGRIKISSGMTFDRMIQIVKILEDFQPDLVIYDCLTSMSCRGVKIGDPAYGNPLRDLTRYNGVAWPKCAHLILHHTTRDEPTRFSGSEQVKAACEELWLYYPPELTKWRRGQEPPAIGPTRCLLFEKSRTGLRGKRVAVTRNHFQATWQFHLYNPESVGPVDLLSQRFRTVTHEEWRLPSEWAKELDLEFNPRSLLRYLDQLVGSVLEVERMKSPLTNRVDKHYRPRPLIREAALEMTRSPGDG